MNPKNHRLLQRTLASATCLALACFSALASAELSESDAKKILKKNDCFKCHAIDKTKKGPSYQKIAEKYRGKADAIEKLNHNLTDAPKVKLEDGTEEEHKVFKGEASEKSDLINWILAQ